MEIIMIAKCVFFIFIHTVVEQINFSKQNENSKIDRENNRS